MRKTAIVDLFRAALIIWAMTLVIFYGSRLQAKMLWSVGGIEKRVDEAIAKHEAAHK